MAELLPRFNREIERQRDNAKIGRIVLATGGDAPRTSTSSTPAGGDHERLRGIPVIARGVGGTAPGTSPEREACR